MPFLAEVLCFFMGKYVVWTFNACTGAFTSGDYFEEHDPTIGSHVTPECIDKAVARFMARRKRYALREAD